MRLWYFVKWCWAKSVAYIKTWNRWQWAWMLTCMWGPNSFMYRELYPTQWTCFMAFVLIFWGLYGMVYTSIKRAYKKFQAEQDRMVDHLKDIG